MKYLGAWIIGGLILILGFFLLYKQSATAATAAGVATTSPLSTITGIGTGILNGLAGALKTTNGTADDEGEDDEDDEDDVDDEDDLDLDSF